MVQLEFRNISKNYGTKTALDGISFSIKNGVCAILGPNGAGKSTMLSILTGLLEPDDGEILLSLEGNNANPVSVVKCMAESVPDVPKKAGIFEKLKQGRNKTSGRYFLSEHLGYMPQQETLYPDFSAEEFLNYIGFLKNMPPEEIRKQSGELLKAVGLYEERMKKAGKMSGGMKQRLRIAQAFLGNPEIVVLDEPTAGLDPEQRVAVRNLIAERCTDRLVLFATHVVSDIEFIADSILIIDHGRILLHDSRNNLLESMQNHVYEIEIHESDLVRISNRYLVNDVRRTTTGLTARIITSESEIINENAVMVHPTVQDAYLWTIHNQNHNV